MVEPVTTGAALVGVGGWFANKLLGPSADALGDQLRAFAGMRLSKILGRAEQLSEGKEPNSLPPGFSIIALQRASISEDAEILTDMWARLLLSASDEFENLHVIFADALSQMGAVEAQFLQSFRSQEIDVFYQNQIEGFRQFQSKIDILYREIPTSKAKAEELISVVLNLDTQFVGSLFSAVINYLPSKEIYFSTGASKIVGKHIQMLDALGRQRLIDFKLFKPARSLLPDRIEAVALTPLGNNLLQVCTQADVKQ